MDKISYWLLKTVDAIKDLTVWTKNRLINTLSANKDEWRRYIWNKAIKYWVNWAFIAWLVMPSIAVWWYALHPLTVLALKNVIWHWTWAVSAALTLNWKKGKEAIKWLWDSTYWFATWVGEWVFRFLRTWEFNVKWLKDDISPLDLWDRTYDPTWHKEWPWWFKKYSEKSMREWF
jgi:hypothetical protein